MAAQPEDAKAYYGYLIEGNDKNKQASPVLDALLRAIAQYIIDEIGDKNDKHLTPPKLAAFYKTVGGDYDALFKEVPYKSISYIWQVTGCQHSIQPGPDPYLEPDIPALTIGGFVRWETIEILLAPEEHVPFMQYAVRHWNLKNALDGKPFPPDLPKEAFPAETDPEIDRWHRECATKLRSESTPKEETTKDEHKHGGFHDSGHRVRDFYNHVRVPAAMAAGIGMAAGGIASMSAAAARASATLRPDNDYFGARPVGVSYSSGRYPPSRQGSGMAARSPEREKDRYPRRHGSSSDERRASGHRRRSFSDIPSPISPIVTQGVHAPHFDQKDPHTQPRRHSQPRHYSSPSDSDEPVSPKTTRRAPPAVHHHHHPSEAPLTAGVRRVCPTPASLGGRAGVPMPTAVPPLQIPVPPHADDRARDDRHRTSSGSRSDDPRRKSFPSPHELRDRTHDFKDRLVSMIPGMAAAERPRSGSRGHRDRERDRDREKERTRYSHEHLPSTSSRLGHSWSNEDGDSEGDSEDEKARRRHRERERDREHERKMRDREQRDRDRNRHGGDERRADRDRDRQEREKERDHRRGRDKGSDRRRERDSTEESVSPRSRKNTRGSSSSYLQRPDVPRRPSSHADLDRRRNRDKDLDWDRDRDRDREERWRRREMERDRDRMPSPVVTGVGGRRYPTELRTG